MPRLLLILIIVAAPVYGQKKTHLTLWSSVLKPGLLSINDQELRYSSMFHYGQHGVYLRREFTETFSLASGISWHNSTMGNLETGDCASASLSTHPKFNIPLYLDISVQLTQRLDLFGEVGFEWMFDLYDGSGHHAGSRLCGNEKLVLLPHDNDPPGYMLLSGGTGLRWQPVGDLYLQLSFGFAKGWKKLVTYDLEYYIDDILQSTYTSYSLGDYLKIKLAFSYPWESLMHHFGSVLKWLDPSLDPEYPDS